MRIAVSDLSVPTCVHSKYDAFSRKKVCISYLFNRNVKNRRSEYNFLQCVSEFTLKITGKYNYGYKKKIVLYQFNT